MAEKKIAKKESSKVDLKEILGDIKTVVKGEKETLFKVSEYKIVKLKKGNLVNSGKINDSLHVISNNDGKLESFIRSIVKDEINSLQNGQKTAKLPKENTEANKTINKAKLLEEKVKPISILNKMTKKELEEYGQTFGFEVDRRLTKVKIINQVKKLK